MKTSSAIISTQEGSAYIRKLCKHFAHKIQVSYTETEGRADYPFGRALMQATSDSLRFDLTSETFEGITRMKYVIVTHLEKFAFRETLEIVWNDEPLPPDPDWEEVGKQLRAPRGEAGRKTGLNMNRTNMGMILRAFELLTPESGHQLLELGPGNGAHLLEVMKKYVGVRYTGVEISETMVQEAHAKCGEMNNVAFLMTDGEKLPFADDSFDRVVTVNTLYFWNSPLTYAKEIRRVLKKDGGLFCVAFVDEEFMKKLPFAAQGFELYNVEKAADLLEQAGFDVRDTISEQETVRSNTGEKVERTRNFILAG